MLLAALGVFILWFGWFGFNPGSTTTANTSIARIAVNTNLAAAAGAVLVMIVTWMKFKNPDIGLTINGALAGLVAICTLCQCVASGLGDYRRPGRYSCDILGPALRTHQG